MGPLAKAEPAKRTVRKPRAHTNSLTALRRQEIVEAAVKVFSRKGFEAARAEDIAACAKMAKGTLYLYFRSKEALYSAAIAHAVQQLQALSSERIESVSGFQEKLNAAIAVRLHFWTDHEVLYRLLMTLGREPRHRRQTNELLHSGQQHLLQIFEEGVAAGEIVGAEYEWLAWAVLDLIRGATERRMDRMTKLSVDADVAAVTTFALRGAGL